MKFEMKLEYSNNNELDILIKKCYFENNNGVLSNKDNIYLNVNKDDSLYLTLTGLSNSTIRILNNELIEGNSRFLVQEEDGFIKLYPCSIYCIIDNSKYSFY